MEKCRKLKKKQKSEKNKKEKNCWKIIPKLAKIEKN